MPHKFSYVLNCRQCGIICLTHDQYMEQLRKPDSKWVCVSCGETAAWDDHSLVTSPYSLADQAMETVNESGDLMPLIGDNAVPSDRLDGCVHEEASKMAAGVNNDGKEAQAAFLVERGWSVQDVIKKLQEDV